ncbi:radical SAM protein [Archaeoglobus veneficus]|uniref:Radical SAM domain protein n=1 Tax=Archaeoglobus veneficus (strain DSM 11195 / SNP6) TaxID=693661 RepID=F2KT45_ARCVS|nr:radical SAM protein [Archaeoglobus veneficus]AEA47075.1 Radical SAM domain protein [Archaeoglobus veneficus SNP6]
MVLGLERYQRIYNGEAVAKFQIARRINAEKKESIDEMWKHHSELKKEFKALLAEKGDDIDFLTSHPADYSFLHLKVDLLKEMLKECCFCERRCGVNRYEKKGFCKVGAKSYYASEFLHMGEEPELIPSHTIFFNRCTFACVFCQNYDIVYDEDYEALPEDLAEVIDRRFRQGSRNVNFVGGNPDQHAHTILETLSHVESNIPVVWNSNMYHSSELAEVIEDVVDVWLGDFKYGNDKCAEKYSRVKNYWKVVTRNFLRAKDNGELLIRHLVMPNHIECCTEPIVKWVAENLGRDTRFNLMFQYYPAFRAFDFPEIARRLTPEEMRRAVEITEKYGLRNLV